MGNPVVHFEIGGKDVEKLIEFYGEVFAWDIIPLSDELYIADPGSDKGIQGHLFQATEDTEDSKIETIRQFVYSRSRNYLHTWRTVGVGGFSLGRD